MGRLHWNVVKVALDSISYRMKACLAVLVMVGAVLADPEVKDSGLKVEYVSKPDTCDRIARNGDMLSMHYTGTLEDGKRVSWVCALGRRGGSSSPQHSDTETRELETSSPGEPLSSLTWSSSAPRRAPPQSMSSNRSILTATWPLVGMK